MGGALLLLHSPNAQLFFTDDVEAQLFLNCKGLKEKHGDSILVAATMVLCLSFLSMFMLPLGLERELGVASAREAMDSVRFKLFVVLDALSFFSSLGTVAVLLQVMTINVGIAQMNTVVRFCSRLAYVAMAFAGAAIVAAATIFITKS